MKKLHVIGTGLVGSLLSIYLARRGFEVEAYERRPDMRREKIAGGRSINLAISVRGLHALEKVGLEQEVLKIAIPMRGRMVHTLGAAPQLQPYGRDDSESIRSVSRAELNKILMTAAERTGRVRIEFNQRLQSMDLGSGEIELVDEKTGAHRKLATEHVIGTDGSASALRTELIKQPRADFSQSVLGAAYKEILLPSGAGGNFQLEKNALHIWPRGKFMLIALPNLDGSFTCTLFLPFEGPTSFEHLQRPADVDAFFSAQFPEARKLIPDLEEQFFAHPTGHMVTIKCFPWHSGSRALLMGDAAHAIVPFFGQGMNCGFEDCEAFDELLAQGGDWERVFASFGRARKPNTDAIADMAVENFMEMSDKVAQPEFQLQKKAEKLLQEKFPGEYVPRYSLVTFSRVPYAFAYEAGKRQAEILGELCRGIRSPEEIDLGRARSLIAEKLAPLRPGT